MNKNALFCIKLKLIDIVTATFVAQLYNRKLICQYPFIGERQSMGVLLVFERRIHVSAEFLLKIAL